MDSQASMQSVSERFATLAPQEFRAEIEKRWTVARKVTETLIKSVESDEITSYEAVKVSSCVAGTLLGYEEFHPRGASTQDLGLVNALTSRIGWERDREPERVG